MEAAYARRLTAGVNGRAAGSRGTRSPVFELGEHSLRHLPMACVMGSMDLMRPLGRAGIRCAPVAGRDEPMRYSRFASAVVDQFDARLEPGDQLDALRRFAATQGVPPVLFYESDTDLLLISRNREVLGRSFRFVVADADRIEDLLDKARFQHLAERLGLPVPRTCHMRPAREAPPADLELPALIKPVSRKGSGWHTFIGPGKARRVETPEQLRALWSRLAAGNVDVLAQELVPGPESRIESYHVYIDAAGEIAAEFTGRKIRTYPADYGQSTALETTVQADVAHLGLEVVRRLGLTGVAKVDFKRAPDGELVLLEVNPRFSLWHHLGAAAGVNIPALVYADLAGLPRPPVSGVQAGVTWSLPWRDLTAVRASRQSTLQWALWSARCEALSDFAWDDPLPFVRGRVWPWTRRRLRRAGVRALHLTTRSGRRGAAADPPVRGADTKHDTRHPAV